MYPACTNCVCVAVIRRPVLKYQLGQQQFFAVFQFKHNLRFVMTVILEFLNPVRTSHFAKCSRLLASIMELPADFSIIYSGCKKKINLHRFDCLWRRHPIKSGLRFSFFFLSDPDRFRRRIDKTSSFLISFFLPVPCGLIG